MFFTTRINRSVKPEVLAKEQLRGMVEEGGG
jgi:hypothetical protein